MGRTIPRWTGCALTRGCGVMLLLTAVAGCGSGTGTVKGQVTFQGKPLSGGTIMFAPVDSKHNSVSREIDENGNFEVPNVPVGEARVSVDNQSLKPAPPVGSGGGPPELLKKLGKGNPAPKKAEPPPDAAEKDGSKKARGTYKEIPSKYYRTDTSGLTYTVTSGTQTKNFELK